MTPTDARRAPAPAPHTAERLAQMKDASERLEASFLAEMLKSSGLGATSELFGGGAGEEQFASFLREAQAAEMAKAGGIGLAEAIFAQLAAVPHAER